LEERVSRESQEQGGTIISDLRTRDRSYWLYRMFPAIAEEPLPETSTENGPAAVTVGGDPARQDVALTRAIGQVNTI
jgi:hypothetical protein